MESILEKDINQQFRIGRSVKSGLIEKQNLDNTEYYTRKLKKRKHLSVSKKEIDRARHETVSRGRVENFK